MDLPIVNYNPVDKASNLSTAPIQAFNRSQFPDRDGLAQNESPIPKGPVYEVPNNPPPKSISRKDAIFKRRLDNPYLPFLPMPNATKCVMLDGSNKVDITLPSKCVFVSFSYTIGANVYVGFGGLSIPQAVNTGLVDDTRDNAIINPPWGFVFECDGVKNVTVYSDTLYTGVTVMCWCAEYE